MSRVFMLSEASYGKGSDYDIVMLYQVLLGRNPENSQVIQDHGSAPFNRALETFLASTEFRDSVLDPIAQGMAVRRHDIVPRPSTEQLDWLFGRSLLDDSQRTILRQAPDWEQFFRYLCSLDGFLDPFPVPKPRGQAREAGPSVARRQPPMTPNTGRQGVGLAARVAALEATVAELQRQLAALRPGVGENTSVQEDIRVPSPADKVLEDAGPAKPSRRRQAR